MARANAGPRRVPCRRSRARHRTDWRASAGHQRAASMAPTLGAARTMEGPAAAAPLETTARAAAQRIQMDSAPHCSWSSSALCWTEESGTRRQEHTGWAAASRNQIRAQAGSSPGGWCSMPTEVIEEGVGMAAFAEDSQTAGGNQRLRRSRSCSQGMHPQQQAAGLEALRWVRQEGNQGQAGCLPLSSATHRGTDRDRSIRSGGAGPERLAR
jgi:hypothetical protein